MIFEADLLRSFRNSWLRGVSASTFCSSMTGLRRRERQEEALSGAELDDSTLLQAHLHWNAVQIRSSDMSEKMTIVALAPKVPGYADSGMTAMRQRAGKVLSRAQLKLECVPATGQEIFLDLANAAVGARL